jgi:hypothetical protein
VLLPPEAKGSKWNMLPSLGLRWWRHMIVKVLHEHWIQVVICDCIAAEATGYRKNLALYQDLIMCIRSLHSLQTAQKIISYQNRICYESVRLKDRRLNVWECIYRRLFFPTASSVWHFRDPLHLTTSPFQLLKGIDNVQKIIVSNIKRCISRSALKFQIYK